MTSKSHYNNREVTWKRDGKPHVTDNGMRPRKFNFKSNKHKNKQGYDKDWSSAIREHLQDEDVDMAFGSSSKGFRKKNKKNRSGSPVPFVKRKLLEGPTGWYRVSIPYGDKHEKNYILKVIMDKVQPLVFWPISWQTFGTTCVFYVDDYKVAEKIHALDKQIQMPNGFRLCLKVHPGTPNVDMNSEIKEKMKLAMAGRYNAATKALDLTKFHADAALQDCFCALFKPIVFLSVMEIIAENIPELEALNLYDNKISVLSYCKNMPKKMPNLKILHMGNNKIRDIAQFDAMVGLPVVDLLLDGNPLCDKFKDQAAYVSEVRKRFPKCMKLDGVDLPPPISFDISESNELPERIQTFLCDSQGEGIVRQFLEQYFLIFDSDNRQPLLQAYHENAMFSFTCAYPYGYGRDSKNVSWLNWYNTDSRNLLRVEDSQRRQKLLRQGHLSVVSFLQDMPETKHDIHSFTVDLSIFTPQMLCLTVTGMFKELKTNSKFPPIRFFLRTLVIVPAGSGFCIANETVHITNALPDQAKEAFKTPVPVAPVPQPSTSAMPSTSLTSSPLVTPMQTPVIPEAAVKEEMVKQMSIKSGMNLEWSLKCLEETQWDFNRACLIFDQLQSQGVVPPEAFVK